MVIKKGAAKPKFIRSAKRVKLGVGIGSVDGNISLVSLNPAGRKSDNGTKSLKSLFLVKSISDPADFQEII